ncbi:hypothetical protein PRIC2_003937 [Phytophthora ramorum]
MDEVEDTYGFGSYAELFDVGPARVAKHLDVGALSRFCMSERRLARFQQQKQQQQRAMFQHVAAKFDGVGIDGGLGALALESGGVVWLQTTQSDSDALQRRKRQLQDISSRGRAQDGAMSAAALFVTLENVVKVQPRTVQNMVLGVELQLVDGHRLELTFMPGPFADASHRDEFLTALKRQMDAATANTETMSTENAVQTPGRVAGGREAGAVRSETKARKTAGTPEEKGPTSVNQKEEFRQLVRRYTQLDPLSEEGLGIAKQVYAGTGYHLGPTTKQIPKFSADMEYRKKTVGELTGFIKRMNQEWSEADAHRQLHTKTQQSRNDDGLFEYTDTDTGARIPLRTYEQRYLEYAKAHEVNPVIHLFPVPENTKKSAQNDTAEQSASAAASNSVESAARVASLIAATLGVDISSSCIIGEDFFSSRDTPAPTDPPTHRAEDTEFRTAVDSARMKLWDSWGSAFARVSGNSAGQAEPRLGHSKRPAQVVGGVSGHSSTRKRARHRRRSLVLPTSDDLQATSEATVPKKSQVANGMPSSGGDFHQPHAKRSRSASQKSDTAHKSKRKARRQSIVSTVDLPVTWTNEGEEKKMKTADKHRTPQNAQSPRPRHPANGYTRETSALEMVGEEDSDLCRLCYSERALVHMSPCNHAVCSCSLTTWGQMSRKLVAGSSRGNRPNREMTVAPSQASTIARLLQWKKHNDAKREVKARLQEDARAEEEDSFLSLAKPLPQGQVQAAAIRNFQAAGELRWKKLMLQAVREQQQLDEEEAECTFRPRLIAQPRRPVRLVAPATSKLKACRPSCGASSNNSTSAPAPQPFRRETDGDVFERLFRPQADAPAVTASQCAGSTTPKRISPRAEAAFIARQERDLVGRQRRRSGRAVQQRFPHKPKLSRHSQEICAALRESGTARLVRRADHCEKRSARQVRYTVPAYPSGSLCKSNAASAPFNSLVTALQQQEKRMRCISKCA